MATTSNIETLSQSARQPSVTEIELRATEIREQWTAMERLRRAEAGYAARVAFCQAVCRSSGIARQPLRTSGRDQRRPNQRW